MNTVDAAVRLDRPTDLSRPGRSSRPWWLLITALLLAAFFMEAVFAGAMMSGAGWARKAHAATALALIASTLAAGVVCLITQRRVPRGQQLGLTLLALAAAAVLQTALGALTAKGANLTWLHVPLGVALVGFAALAASTARKLGGEG